MNNIDYKCRYEKKNNNYVKKKKAIMMIFYSTRLCRNGKVRYSPRTNSNVTKIIDTGVTHDFRSTRVYTFFIDG